MNFPMPEESRGEAHQGLPGNIAVHHAFRRDRQSGADRSIYPEHDRNCLRGEITRTRRVM
jgi:hypothetical protein